MTESIMEWVRRIVIFYIMTDIFVAVIPGKTCRKHVKMFAGIILALIVAEPLISLAGSRFDLASSLAGELGNAYTSDMKMWTMAAGVDGNTVVEPYMDELKKMIDTKAWEYALYVQDCKIDICLDKDSPDFGKIQSVYTTVSQCRNDTIKVESININKKSDVPLADKECEELREYISSQFGIESEKVTVACVQT